VARSDLKSRLATHDSRAVSRPAWTTEVRKFDRPDRQPAISDRSQLESRLQQLGSLQLTAGITDGRRSIAGRQLSAIRRSIARDRAIDRRSTGVPAINRRIDGDQSGSPSPKDFDTIRGASRVVSCRAVPCRVVSCHEPRIALRNEPCHVVSRVVTRRSGEGRVVTRRSRRAGSSRGAVEAWDEPS
jgi:hypothetical protein